MVRFKNNDVEPSMRKRAVGRMIEDISVQMKETGNGKGSQAEEIMGCLQAMKGGDLDELQASELESFVFQLYGSGANLDEMIHILALHLRPNDSSNKTADEIEQIEQKRSELREQTKARRDEIERLVTLCIGTHGCCSVLELQSALEKSFNISLSDEDMEAMMIALEGGGDLCFDCSADDVASIVSSVIDSLIPSLEDANTDAHFYHTLAQHEHRRSESPAADNS